MDPIARYFDLIRRIDEDAKRLTTRHGDGITCRPGCTGCCVNLTVFPVEFHAIRLAMARAGAGIGPEAFDPSAGCGFLNNGLCRIYPFRPIICRTHGLPIVYLDDTSGEPAWEVSFCELNFPDRDAIEFTEDTLLNIEDINGELARINMEFTGDALITEDASRSRIPLKNLCHPPGQH
jgi:Fe-S-cluster containining protein